MALPKYTTLVKMKTTVNLWSPDKRVCTTYLAGRVCILDQPTAQDMISLGTADRYRDIIIRRAVVAVSVLFVVILLVWGYLG